MKFNHYETILEKDSADLNSHVLLLKHEKTGARVFLLSNDDNNKVFYIGFRTTPPDDTGVAHIMEHSVLCGSEKYPLKDPFVELVKGSMNTFLNAMTYPDKTVYPVASTNAKDFNNLMSVYMDAVFRPNIYRHPEIMKQEGWNYSIEDPSEPIRYNGVVYNEMKGAFSSPEGVLDRETLHALFPDTAYGKESGGDPKYIPDLRYEDFLEFHRTYYHPSNSFIYLYGDMDPAERLEWMDREYLSHYDPITVDSEVGLQKEFSEMKVVCRDYAVSEEESEEQNTYLSYNIHCGTNLDPYKYYALQMIQYALVDTQGAPIRQRLLDEGIGKDIISGLETGILQEYFSITAKNAEKEQAERFLQIINEEFRKAAQGGLSHRSLLASLNSLEFKYKEADFGGFPKGLVYGLSALDSWLYDEKEPLMHIECSETFRFLRDNLETGYFENMVGELLADSQNSALVILTPKKGLAAENDRQVQEKLDAYKASLSEDEIRKLVEETKALAAWQEQEDTPEQKMCIPLLSREDLDRKAPGFSNLEMDEEGTKLIFHEYVTNGIAYVSFFFDANQIPVEKLPYLSLLKSVISFVDTDRYTYSELNDEINIAAGGLGADTGVYPERYDDTRYSLLTDVTFRALHCNLPAVMDLVKEILFHAHYRDKKRLYEIVAELKSKLQMALNTSGHVAASLRAASYYSEVSAVREQINGLDFYRFVEELEQNFDQRFETLADEILQITQQIFAPGNFVISYTGDREGLALFRKELQGFQKELESYHQQSAFAAKTADPRPIRERRYERFDRPLEKKNEGFKTSSSVQYVARSGRYSEKGKEYSGSIKVFLTIMRFDYLWFRIRVQGGAYGCMSSAGTDGSCSFVSYRDPNLKRTNEVYDQIPEYLENFDAEEREMTKYVIGTMSSIDTPLTAPMKGTRDMNAYLTGIRQEDVQKAREEIIDTTAEEIRGLAPLLRKALAMENLCVIGAEGKVEEDRELFDHVENLFA
ncbi:MAG: insulinase family protein [Parasporobacterium sp.]|nr:insulinase family protein [Parasporobacterium sp.]